VRARRRGERGYVLATTAILLVPLLAITGMATDVGGWYAQGAKQQKAADAAALAAVVWLPDLAKATEVAREVAERNGFDDDAADIAVNVSRTSTYELKVQIVDTAAPLYFSKLFLSSMVITREAFARYVLPVPMGSPHNYIGTANMVSGNPEGFWAAVNGWCAPKEQGDPFATRYMGNWPSGGIACPGGVDNPEYAASPEYAYDYVIDLPAGRTQPVVLHIYDPAYRGVSPETGGATIDTQFLLRSPDSTPFDDSDNPTTTCSGSGESNPRTYTSGSTDNDATIFGQSGWSQYCTIGTSSPAGRYSLSVRTLEGQANSYLFNAFSLVASYNGNGVACDRRSTATCPGVYAKEWMSIMANAGSSSADFSLAEIGSEHAGKQMEITLFDPGEGGNNIRILDPAGDFVSFTWQTLDGDYSGGPTTSLDVSGCSGWTQIGTGRAGTCRFNERFVVLTVDLPSDYVARYGSDTWWEVQYNFSAAVTDRTTWSVKILGDPVHLAH